MSFCEAYALIITSYNSFMGRFLITNRGYYIYVMHHYGRKLKVDQQLNEFALENMLLV